MHADIPMYAYDIVLHLDSDLEMSAVTLVDTVSNNMRALRHLS